MTRAVKSAICHSHALNFKEKKNKKINENQLAITDSSETF
ncbi:hypothetical protein AJ78_08909 [Emergomyces pasteurianus Ep9510]|uniref:Uncharacterized protein n=1 Tax=Emergomyces pasteurianus Ep9510 TaxID=1447872 RepID=A0A1J9PPP6_9EURO|nr:hypothetical protein AJ78_08909 [Emergomyces pasteurianus Ep9510]